VATGALDGFAVVRLPVPVRLGVVRLARRPQFEGAAGRRTWTRFNRIRRHRRLWVAESAVVLTLVVRTLAGAAGARHDRRQRSLGAGQVSQAALRDQTLRRASPC